ncbi:MULTISPECIES: DNA-binding protein [Listeria]|uniref:DNA-binding protein n=1 Tax=Listeria TaxID=1637 RepID=UPI000B593ED0|nr:MULTISPECIES: DNA-binding protein [Listeria]
MTNLPKIGKPATSALEAEGITTLEQVVAYDEKTLLALHGVGPKAIEILRKALAESGLAFQTKYGNQAFTIIVPADCDNAPKRRIMRDYTIATAKADRKTLEALLVENFVWSVPGEFEIRGRTNFMNELFSHSEPIKSLELETIVSHGKLGSLNGTMIQKNGQHVYFADVFEFENHKKEARICKIISYVIIKPSI